VLDATYGAGHILDLILERRRRGVGSWRCGYLDFLRNNWANLRFSGGATLHTCGRIALGYLWLWLLDRPRLAEWLLWENMLPRRATLD
jgi:hypothetical protein